MFMPQIKQANEELRKREPRSYCIDLVNVEGGESEGCSEEPSHEEEEAGAPVIEMVRFFSERVAHNNRVCE